jgi:hypothetical protein
MTNNFTELSKRNGAERQQTCVWRFPFQLDIRLFMQLQLWRLAIMLASLNAPLCGV